jgi:hypothetical protein
MNSGMNSDYVHKTKLDSMFGLKVKSMKPVLNKKTGST